MKIGFYGNAGNYPFMLARALRRQGHEVLFIISSQSPLYRPESRYPDITLPYPPWIHDLSSPRRWRYLLPGRERKRIQALLNTCDVAVLNEEGPTFADGLRIPFVALLSGSDLGVFADPARANALIFQLFQQARWWGVLGRVVFPAVIIRHCLTNPQRRGIRRAEVVTYFPRGLLPYDDALLDGIGVPDSRRMLLLMADLEVTPAQPPPRNPVVRTFCLARLTWKHEPDSDLSALDYKGSDVMIRGLALFHQRHGTRLDIRLARKGRHVAETRELITALGLSDQVTWLDELSQTQVREEYRQADIIFDQLANGLVAMGGLEALATGRPLIANGRPEIFEPILGEPSPICQARTPEEVCQQLARLVTDPAERARLGVAGRRYVETHFSSDAAARKLLARLALL